MKDIVLSLEQMKHLEELGLDTSDASHYYGPSYNMNGKQHVFTTPDVPEDHLPLDWENFKKEGGYPAYSLQDTLEHLNLNDRKNVMSKEPGEWLNSAYEYLCKQLSNNFG